MNRRAPVPLLLLLACLALVLAACGGGDGEVDPTGGFDRVEGEAPDRDGDDDDAADDPDGDGDAATGSERDGDEIGSGSADDPPEPTPTPTTDGGAAGDANDAGSAGSGVGDADAALAVWDEFLERWVALRSDEGSFELFDDVAVIDEAIAILLGQSVEADEQRGTTSVELHGGTRSDITVTGSTVTFVDCVYEKAVGALPWVLAQRWDVTVDLEAGPGGSPAVTGLTQRAEIDEDLGVVYDVCLNPVLEQEVVAAHVALREMFVETQEDPATGVDDPRIDELLTPADATDFRGTLESRAEDGTRVVNGRGTNIRVQVFGHGLGFAASVSCEDQQPGFGRVDSDGEYTAEADPQLQTLTTVRFVFQDGAWLGEDVQNSSDFSCPSDPLESVNVAGESEDRLTP